ncbi:MAG: hypothetical protein ACYC1C_12140 [Chloroflexota bacterium]
MSCRPAEDEVMRKYDVLVVGAGPAGASAVYQLARAQARVAP